MQLSNAPTYNKLSAGNFEDEIREVDNCLSILSIVKNKENASKLKSNLNASSLSCYKLQQCFTQKEGLQLLTNCKFDIVIVDLLSQNSKPSTIIHKVRKTNYRRPLLALTQASKTKEKTQYSPRAIDAFIAINDLSPSLIENVVRSSIDKYNLSELRNALNQQLNLALDAGKMGAWSYSCESKKFELDTITAEMLGFPPRPCIKSLDEIVTVTNEANQESIRSKFEKAGQDLDEFKTQLDLQPNDGMRSRISLHGRFRTKEAGRDVLLIGIAKELLTHRSNETPYQHPNTIPMQTVLDTQFPISTSSGLGIDKRGSFQKILRKLSNKKPSRTTVENKKFPFDFSRQPITDFSPPDPATEGFTTAAQRLVAMTRKGHSIDVSISISNTPSIEIEMERNFLFSILRELLTNVVKHARASICIITLHKDEDEWVLQVEDDGVGLDESLKTVSAPLNHIGLFSLRTQLALKGGHLDIAPASPIGLIARVRLPICLAR